jgi:hypothetical protein
MGWEGSEPMATDDRTGFYGRLKSITTEDLADLLEEAPIEGTQLELKRFGEDPPGSSKLNLKIDDQMDVLSSMANTAGGKEIGGGIEDDAERLVGYSGVPEDRRRAVLQHLSEAAGRVQPPVRFEPHWVQAPKNKGWVLVVDVPVRRGMVHQSRGRYLHRVGSKVVPMSHAAVTDAILAAAKDGAQPGWQGAAFSNDYPFKRSAENEGRVPDDWWVGALVRAPYPVDRFVDGAGDLMHLEQAFARERLSDSPPVPQRDRCSLVSGSHSISVQYNLSARVLRRGRGAPSVTSVEIEAFADETIGRAARLLAATGYTGPVEVHCCLSQAYAHPLQLREDKQDPESRAIMPHTWECLEEDVLLSELREDAGLVGALAQRFLVWVRRNPDLAAKRS